MLFVFRGKGTSMQTVLHPHYPLRIKRQKRTAGFFTGRCLSNVGSCTLDSERKNVSRDLLRLALAFAAYSVSMPTSTEKTLQQVLHLEKHPALENAA